MICPFKQKKKQIGREWADSPPQPNHYPPNIPKIKNCCYTRHGAVWYETE